MNRVALLGIAGVLAAVCGYLLLLRGSSAAPSREQEPAAPREAPPAATSTLRPEVPAPAPPAPSDWIVVWRDRAAGDPPRHPWAEFMSRKAAAEKLWAETIVDLSLSETPLDEALAVFRDQYGLKTFLDPELDARSRTVTFRVSQLAADQSLDLILKMSDLTWCLSEAGDVCIAERHKIAIFRPSCAVELAGMDSVRELLVREAKAAAKPADPRNAELGKKLEQVRVTLKAEDLSGYDLVDLFQETAQVNVVVSSELRRNHDLETKFNLVLKDVPGTEALAEISKALGACMAFENGVTVIESQAESKKREESAARAADVARQIRETETGVLARMVRVPCEALPLRDLARRLQAESGYPVVLDPALWPSNVVVSIDGAEHPVGAILEAVRREEPMRIAVREGTLWLLAPGRGR